jgi:adenylate cyclase
MRISVRLALSIFVLGTIVITSGLVHFLWWRTAQGNSRVLAGTVNQQIVGAVKRELSSLIAGAKAAHGAVNTIFVQNVIDTREADKREFVFLAQLQAQPALSWIAFGWPDGSFFASHKLGDRQLEMMEISSDDGKRQRRVDRYKVVTGDIEFEKRSFEQSDFDVTQQPWYRQAEMSERAVWLEVMDYPAGGRPGIAYASEVDVYGKHQGVLAVMIDLDRLSRFLASLSVGRSGAAFVLRPDGVAAAVPDPDADELHGTTLRDPTLLAVARQTHNMMLAEPTPFARGIAEARVIHEDQAYAVTVTPLDFMGWEVTTVIPEAEFLGGIEQTMRRLTIGLAALVLCAVAVSTWLARHLIAVPLAKVAAELRNVERFELEKVERHPSRLTELDALSNVIANMATGLTAFRKYLPSDVVKNLVAQGIKARPGGTIRPLTILFTDIAGFTGLSERMRDRTVELLGSYLDLMSREIHSHHGTIDKFIGDAVMAFWGAPAANANHAFDACRAALACQEALARSGILDDQGDPLSVRIGINSGNVLVGNIGSDARLNYTAIGDAVNLASRIEGANRLYGTGIIIGEATRREAGDAISVRELDRIAVYGRSEGTAIYELLGLIQGGGSPPGWVAFYERGLEAYRARNFSKAIELFERVLAMREFDLPSHKMIDRCRALDAAPPLDDWTGTMVLDVK